MMILCVILFFAIDIESPIKKQEIQPTYLILKSKNLYLHFQLKYPVLNGQIFICSQPFHYFCQQIVPEKIFSQFLS